MFKKVVVVCLIGLLAYAYQYTRPPLSKLCGSKGGPPIKASRIKLRDGRYLSFMEHGVPKETAKVKVIFVHGSISSRHDPIVMAVLASDVIEVIGLYLVSFDKPGYGESDPDPKRTMKSLAFDIEELADQLQLGSKFYVIGHSMGGQAVWACLKYIPHRLSGAALLASVVNFWWAAFPANLSRLAYNQQRLQDQWTMRVIHYIPWLTYWWNTQKWFPASSIMAANSEIYSREDKELLPLLSGEPGHQVERYQQGVFESIHRDTMIGFGTWVFDPMDLVNPFLENEVSIHLWHGTEDVQVPIALTRYMAQRLPWINYHEVSGGGHLFPAANGNSESILRALVQVGKSSI